jgi:hypothetical protein
LLARNIANQKLNVIQRGTRDKERVFGKIRQPGTTIPGCHVSGTVPGICLAIV